MRVRAIDAVVVARHRRIAVRDEHADKRIVQQIASARAHDVVVGRRRIAELRLGSSSPGTRRCRPAVFPDTRAPPMIGTGVPAALRPIRRLKNGRRCRPGREAELAGVLDEEVALFGKEQAEARQVHLLLVDFDLREIGVIGRVERQRRREAVLDIHAAVVVLESRERIERRQLGRRRARLVRLPENVRLHLEIAALADVFQTGQGTGQRYLVSPVANRDRRPLAVFVPAENPPGDCRPHSWEGALQNRNVLNGITNSAIHPSSLHATLTSQTPSQSLLDGVVAISANRASRQPH